MELKPIHSRYNVMVALIVLAPWTTSTIHQTARKSRDLSSPKMKILIPRSVGLSRRSLMTAIEVAGYTLSEVDKFLQGGWQENSKEIHNM